MGWDTHIEATHCCDAFQAMRFVAVERLRRAGYEGGLVLSDCTWAWWAAG